MFDKKIEIVLDDTAMSDCEKALDTVSQIYLEMFNHEHKTGKKVVFKTAEAEDGTPQSEYTFEMIKKTWELLEELSGAGLDFKYTIEEKEEEK
jgi:hypothetical protein